MHDESVFGPKKNLSDSGWNSLSWSWILAGSTALASLPPRSTTSSMPWISSTISSCCASTMCSPPQSPISKTCSIVTSLPGTWLTVRS